jgi:outer membrane protein OmpA-like peptidoglycan-associated protein
VGEDDFNMDLSQRRAESVRDYLVELGLARGRFDTAGFGETRPIADNETPEGRQRNRRTEFRVID